MTEMKNHRRERAAEMMKKCGYASGGAVSERDEGEPDMDTRSQRQGKKHGGSVKAHGEKAKKRLDRPKRYASGGAIDDIPKDKKGAKTQVNIIIAGKDGAPAAPMPVPVPVGGPPAPPMGTPAGPPMTPPPGMPMGRKHGGSVMPKNPPYPIDDGAGGGLGRLEKAAAARKTHKRGGKV